jgi:hypothetical protein
MVESMCRRENIKALNTAAAQNSLARPSPVLTIAENIHMMKTTVNIFKIWHPIPSVMDAKIDEGIIEYRNINKDPKRTLTDIV